MKHYLYTLLTLILFSCSIDEPNTPPQAFEVTAKVEGSDVILTWTEAVDAEGDNVTYSVEYAGTFVSGLTTRTFNFKDLSLLSGIVGTVVASDGKGGKTGCTFIVDPSENHYVQIPDSEFERFLIANKVDDILDGRVLKENVLKVKELNFFSSFGAWGNIKNFSGIEHFLNLEEFMIGWNDYLQEIDLSKNIKLKLLSLENCRNLRKVELKNNKELEYLYLVETDLKDVDLSENKKLKTLSLMWNVENGKGNDFIKDINLSANKELDALFLSGIGLEKLDLTNNLNLAVLICDNNKLSHLDLSHNTRLELLFCNHNYFRSLNLCLNSILKKLICSGNDIGEILLQKEVFRIPKLDWEKDATATYKVCN